jgi:adenylate cyclase
MPDNDMPPDVAPTREDLEALLAQIVEHPERRGELEAEIERRFTRRAAVFVLDMSGFSRTTQSHGVVSFLLMIHQMRLLSLPAIEKRGGKLVKAEADNLYCLFDDVAPAVAAARDITDRLETVNVLLPAGRRLYASVGIGYGEILTPDDADLFGDEVNLASKLGEDVADGGVVLLTEQARARLPEDAPTRAERVSVSGLALPYHVLI